MRVCVLGLWHLGTVTAACLAAAGHRVTGIDFDPEVVLGLESGKAPIYEPGLDALIKAEQASRRLSFSTDVHAAAEADVIWVAIDTPVDDDDGADVDYVLDRVRRVLPVVRDGSLVLVSSQVPVGTTRRVEQMCTAEYPGRTVLFAYSPENLRLGNAIAVFTQPDRVVVGIRSPEARARVAALLNPITDNVEWMSVESAEMTKHALNAFLATSITFINEIAALCEQVGADATEVERGLKSEARIGPKAYLSPGGGFAGGTLARDVVFLSTLGGTHGVPTRLLSSVKASNDAHRLWAQRRLEQCLGDLRGKTVAVWGLTYKPHTDTLRRSSSVELCQWLHAHGASVRAHDPAVNELPPNLATLMSSAGTALGAINGASALVVGTPWPEYREIPARDVVGRMQRRLVLDPNRFLAETLGRDAAIEYLSVGTVRM